MVKAGDALHNPVAKETFVILKTAADTGGQLFQMDVTVATGQGTKIPPHVHPVHEMRLVTKAGQMKLWLTDQEKIHTAGSRIVIPARTPYNWRAVGAEDL